VSATGLEFTPDVRDSQHGDLVWSFRLLGALHDGTARGEHHDKRYKK